MKTLHKADFSQVLGTSYYGHDLISTVNKIAKSLGEPHSGMSGDGKVSVEWRFMTDKYIPFTIYDYKEYDNPASENRDMEIAFHIGVENGYDGDKILAILKEYGL